MKYVIVDDEMLSIQVLKELLTEYCPQLQFAGSAYDVQGAITLIAEAKPGVIFLDIEMPGGSGFDLLDQLPSIESKVVFVTSYDQYAIKAFRFNAFDYLLKPVLVSELTDCVRKLEDTTAKKTDRQIRADTAMTQLHINHQTRLEFVNFTDIIYLKGDGNYTCIYTSGKEYYTSKTLKEYDELLCTSLPNFIRIHRAHIINLHFVEAVLKGDQLSIRMKNGERLDVSRRKRVWVQEKLNIRNSGK